ncbi:hypothetical protein Tco_1204856 [Tanacetum coccineum]
MERESLSLEVVLSSLNSRELKKEGQMQKDDGDGVLCKGVSYAYSEDHLKKDCPHKGTSKKSYWLAQEDCGQGGFLVLREVLRVL